MTTNIERLNLFPAIGLLGERQRTFAGSDGAATDLFVVANHVECA